MRVFQSISAILILFSFSSCLRLDDNLFNNDNTIAAYLLDEYEGEVDFRLGPEYDIPPQLIHEFTLQSQTAQETNSTNIAAIYIGALNRISQDTVILYCHGNRDHMDFYWQRAKLLAHSGGKNRYSVLMMDYRGYGLSEGKPTEEGMYADVASAIDWLQSNGLTGERLIAYGFSLGSAAATDVAANPSKYKLRPAKLILEAPFASTSVMVQDASLLSMPSSFFTNAKVNNADKIRSVTQPFLWIHGINDAFLNIKTHGEVVYKNYGGTASFPQRIPGADHSDVPKVMGFESYNHTIAQFIKSPAHR